MSAVRAFRTWFGICLGEARLLETLYLRPGEFLTGAEIGDVSGLSPMTVRTYVQRLRKAMESEALDSLGDYGPYAMTEVGEADCRAAISDHAKQNLAA